jgi:hypothetical protein
MATGKATDFVIYQDEFYGGMYEKIGQNVNGFNGASKNAIKLVAKDRKGDYNKESFFKDISTLISRRDTTSVAAATILPMQQDEVIGVKVHRKIGPVEQTLDAWRKLGEDGQRAMSFKLGQMVGERKMKDYINTAILAVEGALEFYGATANFDYSGTGTINHGALVKGLAKFGDAAERLVCWVMHSKAYYDLVGQAITDKVYEVAGATIYSGTVPTLGRPVLVIDAPALYQAGAPDKYPTLCLTDSAVVVEETEQEEIVSDIITGNESLSMRIQGEYAFNVNLKGFKWDMTNGGKNPTDVALATSGNWDNVMSDVKNIAGVRLLTQ